MSAHGARPIWASHVGVENVGGTVEQSEVEGGKAQMLAHDADSIGRIAMVADPLGAQFALVGTV